METNKFGMKNFSSLIILFLLVASIFVSFANAESNLKEDNEVNVYFFWGEGCPHCNQEKQLLEALEIKYSSLNVKSYEVWGNPENAELFLKMSESFETKVRGVPTTFIGDSLWIGYADYMGREIEEKIMYCIENECLDPIERLNDSFDEIVKIEEIALPLETICIHLFVTEDCTQCSSISDLIGSLSENYEVEFRKHDVSFEEGKKNYEIFKEAYGLEHGAHPIVFIGNKFLMGEKAINENLESEIISCTSEGCECPTEKIRGFTPFIPKSSDYSAEEKQILNIPFIGEFDLSSMSMGVVTILIASIDGFNPCSLWVLTFLLGIVIYTGSRKKIVLIGLTFLLVTATAYGLFILGLLNVFLYIGYLTWIKVGVSLVAGIFAFVSIKDYFWYKKGISFTIPDKYKPKIFRDLRKIMKGEGSIVAMVSGTVIMSLGIVLVELPCTAGFPVIWTSMVARNNITGTPFIMLFLLYLLMYLLIELAIFGTVVVTLKTSRFEEKHGRILKLIGGMIMLALAFILLFMPELMNDIRGAVLVFGVAILVSFMIMFIHRKVLPRYGIKIGTEELKSKTLDDEGNNLGNDEIANYNNLKINNKLGEKNDK